MGCNDCGTTSGGGVHTNFDPYGTRRKLGLPAEPPQFFCWPCWEGGASKVDAAFRQDTVQKVIDQGGCGFVEAWIGHCLEPRPCAEHRDKKCWHCSGPATSNCSEAGSFVCGMPQCADHPHVHRTRR